MINLSGRHLIIFGIVLLLVATASAVTMLLGYAGGRQAKRSSGETLVAERATAAWLAETATTTGRELATVESAATLLAEEATKTAEELATVKTAVAALAQECVWSAEYWQGAEDTALLSWDDSLFPDHATFSRQEAGCSIHYDLGWDPEKPLLPGFDKWDLPKGLPKEYYLVRWTREQYFSEGWYVFTLGADDGVRLDVDENKPEHWHSGPDLWRRDFYNEYRLPPEKIKEGMHTLKVDYFQWTGPAQVRMTWERVAPPTPTPTPAP